MRRWLPACLVLAACGRWDFDPVAGTPDAPDVIAPLVCQTTSFPSLATTDIDVDLSVAVTPGGVTIGWISHTDGPLMGANLDASAAMTTNASGTMIKAGGWIGGTVGYVDGTLVAAETEDTQASVKLDTLGTDLGNQFEFGCPSAVHASRPPFVHAAGHLVAPILDATMFSLQVVDAFATPSQAYSMAVQSDNLAAVEASPIAMVAAIASSTDCSIFTTDDLATFTTVGTGAPCKAPRLAANPNESVALTYETATGIVFTRAPKNDLATTPPARMVAGASSPRVVWDGARYWVAFLAQNGSIVVGHVDATGAHEVVLPLTPKHDAFELAIVGGAAWIYAFDASGLSATRLCMP